MRAAVRWMAFLAFAIVSGRCVAVDRYVNVSNAAPVSPFLFASTAAIRIQDAVEVSSAGDVIWVTNGVYASGGKVSAGGITNRVCIDKAVTVRSINGPGVTVIKGAVGVGGWGGSGTGAVRCVYLTNGAILSGFTITNGHTLSVSTDAGRGGGVYSTSGIVTNCVIVGNVAAQDGGGVFGGQVFNSLIVTNWAWNGGGVDNSVLYDCDVRDNVGQSDGGGLSLGTAYRCVIRNNRAVNGTGGGAFASALFNCLIYGNSARIGGGLKSGRAVNCTVCSNSASISGGGFSEGHGATNSIVYFNSAPVSNNWEGGAAMQFCCTTPMPSNGANNTTVAPTFVGAASGDYRLAQGSSCVDAGTNQPWMAASVDLGGLARILNGRVDIGAYEYAASPWAGAADLGGGWKWLSWFEFFNDAGNGWIYHNEHHWMYAVGTDPTSIWLWTSDMGWLWTGSTVYPSLYRSGDAAWLWYQKGSVSPRWFYNYKTGAWESH